MKTFRWATQSLVVLALLLMSRAVWAGTTAIIIDLAVSERDVPTHVCVVHENAGLEARTLGNVWNPDARIRQLVDVDERERKFEWSVPRSKQWPAENRQVEPEEVRSALHGLRPEPGSSGTCGADDAACRPMFTLSPEPARKVNGKDQIPPRYLLCARNRISTTDPARVLLLSGSLPADTNNLPLDTLVLTGTVLTMRFTNNEPGAGNLEASVNVLGGHFEKGRTISTARQHGLLPLAPRCQVREVELPKPYPAADAHSLEVVLDSGTKCSFNLSSRSYVAMPPSGTGGSVTAKFVRRHLSKLVAEFVARWSTRDPPANLDFRPTKLGFTWERDCGYPIEKKQCPAASLSDVGIACGPGVRSGKDCNYECDATNTPFPLPTTVTFSAGDVGTWAEKLHYPSETLRGYVDAAARRFDLDLTAWGDVDAIKKRVGDRVESIEIDLPSGATYRFEVQKTPQYVALPGATCDGVLRQRLVGERGFEDRSETLTDGQMIIHPPSETARVFSGSVLVGSGLLVRPFGPGRFYGLAELQVRAHAKQPIVRASLLGPLHLLTEFRLAYFYVEEPYFPLYRVDLPNREIPFVAYSRVIVSLREVVRVADFFGGPIDVAVDPLSGGGGRPVFSQGDIPRAGDVKPFLAPNAFVRWHPFRHVLVDARVMLIYPDWIYASRSDLRGPAQHSPTAMSNFSGGLSIGYTMF